MLKHLTSFISNLYDKSNQASMDGIQMGEQLKKIIPYLYSELLEHMKNIKKVIPQIFMSKKKKKPFALIFHSNMHFKIF